MADPMMPASPVLAPAPDPPINSAQSPAAQSPAGGGAPSTDADGWVPAHAMVPWLVAVAFFMESLDTTILNTAVPTIAAALKIAPLNMKSVLSSYTLSVAVFIPLSGWVADRFGTRRVFASAIGMFALGSALCGVSTNIHFLTLSRILQGIGGAMMVPVGRLTMIRTFPKSQLVRAMAFVAIPSLIGPMLGPLAGGFIVRFFHWRVIFFLNVPIGLTGLYLVYRHLPDYRGALIAPLDYMGLVLFGCGVALLSYVLEVFGEHTLGGYEMLGLLTISFVLLIAYQRHAATNSHPLLNLELLRIRTLRTAILGSFVTRIGVGGLPFLLPLLYQIGLGYSALQSGLLILPQSLAAMSLRLMMPRLLRRFGYRRVLLTNTLAIGVLIALYARVGPQTPAWSIALQTFAFGFFASFQYTSMNTLVYAEINDTQTSMASTMASTSQQMSMSFGVAGASLAAAFFIPRDLHGQSAAIITGIHRACIALGAVTVISTLLFRKLHADDGANISRHNVALPTG